MALSPFQAAINQIADEKNLDKDTIFSTVEAAVAAAYRKEYGKPRQHVISKMDPEEMKFKIFRVFTVVEDDVFENEEAELTVEQAKEKKKDAKVGDEIEEELPEKSEFGRIAAQTAKQVIIQRLREAERNAIFDEYKDKTGMIIPATVQQLEGSAIIVSLGKSNALLLPSDQIRSEHYYVGQRIRVYLKEVEESPRGPKILVSRSDPKLIEGLFTLEVPEIQAGTVELKGVAREAGERSKVAVHTNDQAVDPVGSAVGQRGTRIQAILAELGEEKIDIILWDENPGQFIANALSPARIDEVTLDQENKVAKVYCEDDQLSLAIGKNGQNVRLASKLTGFEIDIIKAGEQDVKETKEEKPKKKVKKETTKSKKKETSPEQKGETSDK